MKKIILASMLTLIFATIALAQDPGWSRQKINSSGKLVYYQPQFVEWDKYKSLTFSIVNAALPRVNSFRTCSAPVDSVVAAARDASAVAEEVFAVAVAVEADAGAASGHRTSRC